MLDRNKQVSWLQAASIVLPSALFLTLAAHVAGGRSMAFDVGWYSWLRSHSSPLWETVFAWVTHGGDIIAVLALMAVTIGVCLRLEKPLLARIFFLSVAGAVLLNLILKALFERDRPDILQAVVVEQSFSFPSGHAMASSALALSLMILLWQSKWRWWAVVSGGIYLMTIGLSRLYLGVHFPSDVLAGWCVSWLWVLSVFRFTSNR